MSKAFTKVFKIAGFLRSWLLRLWGWQPLSARGFICLLLATLALRALAIPEYDLVANIIGWSVLALIGLSVLIGFFLRLRLASKLQIEVFFDQLNAFSRQAVPAGLVLENSSIAPFFNLSLSRKFVRPGVKHPLHIVKNRAPRDSKRHLLDEIFFPHRGYWELEAVKCTLADALGLTRFSWTVALKSALEVSAERIPVVPLPIVASSARAGDQLSQTNERAGDLFDLKAYDPSDGTKRILWKIFAKSGQLIVRRPEPAIIPEGEVAIYLIAGPKEDFVVGAMKGYMEQLVENQISILFGTDGLSRTGSSAAYCSDLASIEHAINRSVWDQAAGSGKDFEAYLNALQADNRPVANVVIFAATDKWYDKVASIAQRHDAKLFVALVPKEIDPAISARLVKERVEKNALERQVRFLPSPLRQLIINLLGPQIKRNFRPKKFGAHGSEFIAVQARDVI